MRVNVRKQSNDELDEIEASEVVESASDASAQIVNNKTDLFASFGEAEVKVLPVVIEYPVEGESEVRREQYFIKKLSLTEYFVVDAKRLMKQKNGQPIYDQVYEETVGWSHQIAACVVTNKGTDEEPDWKPLFAPHDFYKEEVMAKGQIKKSGLMTNGRAEMFIWRLLSAVWEVNPSLSPLVRAAGAQQIQEQNAK